MLNKKLKMGRKSRGVIILSIRDEFCRRAKFNNSNDDNKSEVHFSTKGLKNVNCRCDRVPENQNQYSSHTRKNKKDPQLIEAIVRRRNRT